MTLVPQVARNGDGSYSGPPRVTVSTSEDVGQIGNGATFVPPTSLGRNQRPAFVPGRVGRWFSDHPEWLTLTLSAVLWVPLAWTLAGTVTLDHHHGSDGAPHPSAGFDTHLLIWTLMVAAMMLPTTIPHLRYVGFATRVRRRQRSVLLFALGYLSVWTLPGFTFALLPLPIGSAMVALAVMTAAAWELTPIKQQALRRCCRTWPIRYAGAAADSSALEYGVRHGAICLLVSGPAMIVLMLAGHPWWATVALAVLRAAQKLLSDPLRWRTVVALGWLAAALAVAGVAAFD